MASSYSQVANAYAIELGKIQGQKFDATNNICASVTQNNSRLNSNVCSRYMPNLEPGTGTQGSQF